MEEQDTPTKADAIEEEVLRDPFATHQEVAERVETSRPYVSETLSERPHLRDYRERAREGLLVYSEGPWAEDLADILHRSAVFEETTYGVQEIARAIRDGRIEAVRITPVLNDEL